MLIRWVCLIGLLATLSNVQATVYSYRDDSFGYRAENDSKKLYDLGKWSFMGIDTGTFDDLLFEYDDESEVLHVKGDFVANRTGDLPNGFWLVVGDGDVMHEHPTNERHNGRYAVLYGDTINNRISAYVYSSRANDNYREHNSWQRAPDDSFGGEYIGRYDDVMALSGTHPLGDTYAPRGSTTNLEFSIDVSAINDYEPEVYTNSRGWEGINFDDEVSIWFNPLSMRVPTYNTDSGAVSPSGRPLEVGAITSMGPINRGYYSAYDLPATARVGTLSGYTPTFVSGETVVGGGHSHSIKIPGATLLLALGLGLMAVARCLQSAPMIRFA